MNCSPLRGGRRFALVLALTLCSGGAAVAAARGQDRAADERMPVTGGTAALLRACRVQARVEPARAIFVLARAVHTPTSVSNQGPLAPEAVPLAFQGLHGSGAAVEFVPALLPLATWQNDVFGRQIGAEDLVEEIITDRRAALLYYGLFSLDDETLRFFVAHPAILTAIYRDHAAVFADFAESITVRAGAVVLPGDAGTRPIWENLAGAPANAPEHFIPRLLGRDEGRLAWMFDTIAHLDTAHQDFALARRIGGPEQRAEAVKALYAIFAGFQRQAFPLSSRPFVHPSVGPAFVLAAVAVTDDGRLAPPAGMSTWAGPFAVANVGAGDDIMAPWLLEHIFTPSGRSRLDTFLFAQRLFAGATRRGVRIDDGALAPILAAFAKHQALLLTLERLGFVDPRDYALALQAAGAQPAAGGAQAATFRAAMVQGALALVVRLHEVGTLDGRGAQELTRMLLALPTGDSTGYWVLEWIERALMPALSSGRPAASMDAEEWLLDGLSGAPAKRPTPVVQWEDQSYRVDLAAAERVRLRQMLEKQGAYPLNVALDLRRLASSSRDPSAPARLADLVSTIDLVNGGTLFGISVPDRGDAILSDLRRLQRDPADSTRTQAVRQRCQELVDVLLADTLAAHVYAIAIEEPDSSLLLVDHPARAHDFDVGDGVHSSAWTLPANVHLQSSASTSAIRGSLLGLERAIAQFSLRRTTLDAPAVAPVLGQAEMQGLAESAVALNPFRLTDAGRDAIAAALRQGRQRVAAAARDPSAVDALVAGVGVERWRRRLVRWAAAVDPGAVMGYLSLGEILALGSAGALPPEAQDWGVPGRFIDGSFAVRLPMPLAWHQMSGRRGTGLLAAQVADLPLRIAEALAALKLPAALAHGVLQYATWHLIGNVQMADLDDWLAVIRAAQAVTDDDLADYVSALTADGPMVPAK